MKSNVKILLVCLLIFGALMIGCIGVIIWLVVKQPYCSSPPSHSDNLSYKDVHLDLSTGDFEIQTSYSKLRGVFKNVAKTEDIAMIANSKISDQLSLSHEIDGEAYTLKINALPTNDDAVMCYHFTETSSDEITTCFDYGSHHWYGAAEVHDQHWPIEKWNIEKQEFVTRDPYEPGVFGSVQERYWLSSHAAAVFVPFRIPLFVSMSSTAHNNEMCFSSRLKDSVYHNTTTSSSLQLVYDICHSGNMTELHTYMARNYWSKPSNRPNLDVLVKPIWSTWATYKKDINASSVTEYADRILQYNLSISQLEIDDDWTPHYGDWVFNSDKFPNAKRTIQELKSKVPAVTVWIHPFINTDASSFIEAADKNLLMTIADGNAFIPGLKKWWNPGYAGLLDFSYKDTQLWFLEKLNQLRSNLGVDSFKFDAGEIKWMPQHSNMHIPYFHPSEYIKYYVDVAVRADPRVRRQEVRIGCRTQNAPILVRMLDRRSRWGIDNGLKTLIPAALTFGLIGYPFVLPDMIGGNAYDGAVVDSELYIRWLQVNVFLPAIQFSIPPWDYSDPKIIDHTKAMLNLRESYTWLFDKLSNESVTHGWPMVRPLWWLDPTDVNCLTIDDQFLLGNDLLVAPIVQKGSVERDIYLPAGLWLDRLNGDRVLEGGKLYQKFPVSLYQLPYFVRQNTD